MESFIRTFILTAIAGGIFWAAYSGWVRGNGVWYAAWSGVIFGVIAGLAAATIARYRENKVAESLPVLDGEVVVHDGRAMHDGMSGWLYVTTRRILFEGYPTDETSPEISTLFDRFPSDAEGHHLSIALLEVVNVTPRSMGVDPRVEFELSDGRKLSFSTEGAEEWVEEISTARQLYLDEPRSEEKKLFP